LSIQGINCVPSIFQLIISNVIEGIENTSNYFDDIFIYSNDIENHGKILSKVLIKLNEFNLKINKKKSYFFKSQILLLGCVISKSGITPNHEKLVNICGKERPTNGKMMKSFLGVANYFRRFIIGYSSLFQKFEALRKKKDIIWTEDLEVIFKKALYIFQVHQFYFFQILKKNFHWQLTLLVTL
jgi:hypothetical protein